MPIFIPRKRLLPQLVALAPQSLTIAAFSAMGEIVRAAVPAWKKLHPNVDIKVVSRQFNDHYTTIATPCFSGLTTGAVK